MQYFYLVIMCFQCRTRAADKFLKNAPQLLSGKTIKLRLACIWVKCGFSSAATSAFYTFKIRRSADPHFTPGHSRTRTGHLADWSTLGLDNSRTGQVADWTTRGCHRQLCVLSFRSFGGICETANCPVCEMSSPRVGNPRVGVSASCPVTPKESARRYLLWKFTEDWCVKFTIFRENCYGKQLMFLMSKLALNHNTNPNAEWT